MPHWRLRTNGSGSTLGWIGLVWVGPPRMPRLKGAWFPARQPSRSSSSRMPSRGRAHCVQSCWKHYRHPSWKGTGVSARFLRRISTELITAIYAAEPGPPRSIILANRWPSFHRPKRLFWQACPMVRHVSIRIGTLNEPVRGSISFSIACTAMACSIMQLIRGRAPKRW